MTLFAMKDETLPKLVINGLLRFWPCGCSNKELLFLQVRQRIGEERTGETTNGGEGRGSSSSNSSSSSERIWAASFDFTTSSI